MSKKDRKREKDGSIKNKKEREGGVGKEKGR